MKLLARWAVVPLVGLTLCAASASAEDKQPSPWANWIDKGKDCASEEGFRLVTTPDALYSRSMLPLKGKAELTTLKDGTRETPAIIYNASENFRHYYMLKNDRIYHVGMSYFGEYLTDPPGFVEETFFTRCQGDPNPRALKSGTIPFPAKPRVEIAAQVVTNMMARQEPLEKIQPVLNSINTLKDLSVSPFDNTLQKVWPAGMLPPLTWAVVNHANADYVKALLAKGAAPKIKYNAKPLVYYAACDEETLKLLIAAGAKTSEKSEDGKSFEDMKKQCVVEHALNPNNQATSKTPLSAESQHQLYTLSSLIVSNAPLEAIKSALNPIAGLNILASDDNGNITATDKPFIDPMVAAVTLNRNVAVVDALIKKLASANKNYKNVPIVFYAACNGNVEVTQALLRAGVDPNIKHPNGMGLKEFAEKCKKPDVAAALSYAPKS